MPLLLIGLAISAVGAFAVHDAADAYRAPAGPTASKTLPLLAVAAVGFVAFKLLHEARS